MPSSRSPRALVQEYADHLNGVLNATVTKDRLVVRALGVETVRFVIEPYQNERRKPLQLSSGFLHFSQLVSPKETHVTVEKATYIYSTSSDRDDQAAWIFRYEYDREPDERKPQGHLHVNAERAGQSLSRIHFPAGRLSVEQILAHLVLEHGVRPFRGGEDQALGILADSHRGFLARRTDQDVQVFP